MDVKNDKIELNKKIFTLSEEDELWNSYKILHIAKFFQNYPNISKNFKKVI